MTEIDFDKANRFLNAISFGEDDRVFTFQTIDDSKENLPHLRKNFSGTFSQCFDMLKLANENGAGVFVTINKTDGRGRKEHNIIDFRSIFIDSDNGNIDPGLYKELHPNILVNSKNGQHAYWLLLPGEDKDIWKLVQEAFIERFKTDPSVKDVPRVMRLPGFFHKKSEPYLVSFDFYSDIRFSIEQIVESFSFKIEKKVHVSNKQFPSKNIDEYENVEKRCLALLNTIPEYNGVSEGGRDPAGYRVLSAIFDFYRPGESSRKIFEHWNLKNSPPMDDKEIDKIWNNAQSYRSNPYGCALDEGRLRLIEGFRESPWGEYESNEESLFLISSAPKKECDDEWMGWKEDSNKKNKKVIKKDPKWLLVSSEVEDLHDNKSSSSEKKESAFGRVGVDPNETDEDLEHSDTKRDPVLVSNMIIREYKIRRDDAKCVYIYNNKFWEETSMEFIHKLCMQYTAFDNIQMKDVREAANIALTKRHMRKISWNKLGLTEIAFNNGIYDFMTGKLRDHDEEYYLDRIIPYDWNPNAKCPTWLKVLDDWFPGQEDEKEALQEFFGYILCSHAKYKKCLILFGGFDTGKSQVCAVAHELAGGSGFVCGISPDEMDDPKKLAPIKGKTLNIVPDLKKNTVLADGGFKRLVSTGDPIQIDQKYTRSENYVPTAKHIFATNNLPVVTDSSGAVFKRLLILPFKHRIPEGKQDPELIEKLKNEMQGIISWSVDGAIKLFNKKGKWIEPESSKALLEEYKLYQNPLFFFIKESGLVEIDEESKIPTEELRNMVNEFNGGKPYGRRSFTQLIESVCEQFPEVKKCIYSGRSFVKGLRKSGQMSLEIVR